MEFLRSEREQGETSLGEQGSVRVRKAEEERAGARSSKREGNRRNGGKLGSSAKYFQIKKVVKGPETKKRGRS